MLRSIGVALQVELGFINQLPVGSVSMKRTVVIENETVLLKYSEAKPNISLENCNVVFCDSQAKKCGGGIFCLTR